MPRAARWAGTAFLTTQPGWAFATLAELRARGVEGHVPFRHRDSTLLLPSGALPRDRLLTPADAYGTVIECWPRGDWDATRVLASRLGRVDLRAALTGWLAAQRHARRRGASETWSVGAEGWGATQVQRRQLRELVAQALRAALPRWREATGGGVRLLVKADARALVLGVQLYSNLEDAEGGRPGALREHLACGLLLVAGAHAGGAVVDPFLGSGTILAAAMRRFGVARCLGAEVDAGGLGLARRRLAAAGAAVRLRQASFDAIEVAEVPDGAVLVSNLPFGARFERVETRRLVGWLGAVAPRVGGMALLMSREQAVEVAAALRLPRGERLRVKNVLVLGQPAAIAVWPARRM